MDEKQREQITELYKEMMKLLPSMMKAMIDALPRVIKKIQSGEYDELLAKAIIKKVNNDD